MQTQQSIKVGIIFGGPSREREISFAGGRTVYDNLDKTIFTPIPIFVDSLRNLILLDWQYIYKGTIRDFYPPVQFLPETEDPFQIYIESLGKLPVSQQEDIFKSVGRKIEWSELPGLIDFAFLTLHGVFGEDGQIQGLLESLGIPYTGSGIVASAIGMDKALQKKLMKASGFAGPEVRVLSKQEWLNADIDQLYKKSVDQLGLPLVIRPANQGSSIGVAIIDHNAGIEAFTEKINKAFFRKTLKATDWSALPRESKIVYLQEVTDIREGVGFPLGIGENVYYHPASLLTKLDEWSLSHPDAVCVLEGYQTEQNVILESFIDGREFSCIVIRTEEGDAVALPPTEIIKGKEVFDYRSKYMPGLSRKVTPIDLPASEIEAIRSECEKLFSYFEFRTYARIDGFINKTGQIFLNDPNTTSGMLPSSFFFHQAAEIGLDPSRFLTFIIRISIQERIATTMEINGYGALLKKLDHQLDALNVQGLAKKKVAVILGGYSFERHISVESGRNIYEKLSSSDKYEPIPIFLTGDDEHHELYKLPIQLLLKDNADDIKDKIDHFSRHAVTERIKERCKSITRKYGSRNQVFEPVPISYDQLAEEVDAVFIALHGRPGEDGNVQKHLEAVGLPYNGSGIAASRVTINKYDTLQRLKAEGFVTADQVLLSRNEYESDKNAAIDRIVNHYGFPLVAKPVDDGCSSAVRVIRNRSALEIYLKTIFRDNTILSDRQRDEIRINKSEEFPQKEVVLFENMISSNGASKFLEITGGLLTHHENGEIVFEMFEPSEALAEGEILSLEEKFLAGEGQNITPARFSPDKQTYERIASAVKADLQKAAQILGVSGYARIDAFVRVYDDGRIETIVIEVNSLPGMTPATCIFHQTAINGYKPFQFIDKILEFGMERKALEPAS